MIYQCLVTLLFLECTFVFADVYMCPGLKICTCTYSKSEGNSKINLIDCKNKGLLKIPNFEQFQNTKIKKLILANNSFRSVTIDNSTFSGLKITELDLSNNAIDSIQSHAFVSLKQTLKILHLDNIGLKFDELRFLKNLKLERLSLTHNMVTDSRRLKRVIPKHNLIELRLSHNNFTRISDNAFISVKSSLQILHLENTNLDFSHLGFLTGLTKLKALYAGGNIRQSNFLFLDEPFKDLTMPSLQRLSFRNCQIHFIKDNCFTPLVNLTYLDLSRNQLRVVPLAILKLGELTTLDLSYNKQLDHIHEKSFRALSKLKKLNLQGTGLRTIPGNTFVGLGNTLEELTLSDTTLPGGYFWVAALRPLQSLRKLDISNNKITHILNDTFNYLLALDDLDLSGNTIPLSKFTDTLFQGVENTLKFLKIRNMKLKRLPNEALSILEKLEILDASNNRFVNISNNFFAGIKANKIILDNTNITSIQKFAFSGLKGPVSLQLDKNNISNLKFTSYVKPHYFKHLSLNQNPLRCDCDIVSLMYLSKAESAEGVCTDSLTYDVVKIRSLWRDDQLLEMCGLSESFTFKFSTFLLLQMIFLHITITELLR